MAGPAEIRKDSTDFDESFVVFADVLGTGAATSSETGSGRFLRCLIEAEAAAAHRLESVSPAAHINYRLFSDSLIVSTSRTDPMSLKGVLRVTAQMQLEFLYRTLPLRGALAKGPYRRTDRLECGLALTAAARAESHLAKYPRVIILPAALSKVDPRDAETRRLLVHDSRDDYIFINFLSLMDPLGRRLVHRVVAAGMADPNDSVAEKYIWLGHLYNFSVDGRKIRCGHQHQFERLQAQ